MDNDILDIHVSPRFARALSEVHVRTAVSGAQVFGLNILYRTILVNDMSWLGNLCLDHKRDLSMSDYLRNDLLDTSVHNI